MINITKELKAKLLTAQSAGEAAAMVKADGQQITPEETIHLWEEIKKGREQDGRRLSVEELEAVSGGGEHRNWVTDGCAATVEYGSWCSSNDRCYNWDVTYECRPTDTLCPNCGQHMYLHNRICLGGSKYDEQYRCKFCGCIISTLYDDCDGSNDYAYRR